MTPFLPSDCLREIFEQMQGISGSQKEERESLLSCLLVNRLWCETTIEILWRNPWRLGNFYTDESYWISLSRTIFLCFSEEQKDIVETLTNENNFSAILWNYNANIIENELWKLFMSKCSCVKYLELPSTSILHFLGADQCLTSLHEFICSTYSPSKLFLDLAQVCRNIKKMVINPCGDDNEGLEALISLQNNLQQVKLCSIEGDSCEKIGKALETQSKSLISITFEFCICVPVTTLCNLTELKSLKILVKDIDTDLEDLICAELPKLEILEIINSAYQPLDLYTSLIQTTHGFLRKIHFGTAPHPSEGELKPYINSIINFCPNIEDIILWYIEEIYDDLEQLLSSCRNIKYLGLEALSTFSNLEESCGSWRFSALELETFLKSWKGRNPLYLSLFCDFDMGDEYSNILNDFQSNGTLKGWCNIDNI
ncbi:2703_t:CDS:2 [Rhizophagus irregularis]|nr:2703_t:CDS:2 [Rhizophagus irregularis]